MIKLLVRWAITALAIAAAFYVVPDIGIEGNALYTVLGLAVVFGLVNALIRPVLMLLTCPLIILTLGLGTLVINTVMFMLSTTIANWFGATITIPSFWHALGASIVVSIVSGVLSIFVSDDNGRD
ncbi:MAG TPA: phage holin family protein [Anaerolineales bacterium]|nr:phage holin family protein [Anaerolineales bacterium]